MKKVLLIIRDGWGHGAPYPGNAITLANVPNHKRYTSELPTCVLKCTGNDVGNPHGAQGGSEVGHLTIGAGRIVWQPYELINQLIANGEFFKNEVLLAAIENCRRNNSNLHIAGLFSTEGIHADYRHMFALLELCKQQNFNRVYVHLCLDGRDMPEKSALSILEETENKLQELGIGKIASVYGRYYGMDRDTNWNRTQAAYDVMVEGKGFTSSSAKEAIEQAYARGDKTDYYVQPTAIVKNGKPLALIKDGDSFIWYNFRTDRSKQITAMMNDLSFCTAMPEKRVHVHYVCFCGYEDSWVLPVAFPQLEVSHNLGEVLSAHGLKQLRIAETEKFAHVTFFFNSQIDKPNAGEDYIMVPSPKVPSYDLQPEMSAYGVTEQLLQRIGQYDFIALNYANPDLVGHSGILKAVIKACEVVDECIGKVIPRAVAEGYEVLLMADHGNADHMLYDNGEQDPSHGLNPVLMTLISNDPALRNVKLRDGGLKDVAPTILQIMGLEKPKEMTGESLIVKPA